MSRKRLRLGEAGAGVGQLARGHRHAVVVLRDGVDYAAGGEIGAGSGDGLGGDRAVIIGAFDGGVDIAMDLRLIVVDMRSIVRDEDAAWACRWAGCR